ncbi:MAG: double zinc ribbon domain-containing protein [Planctomycetaceae bacterium]|nr:double zinc ribbon domain-containing protein [Planctomycetaceae bacterium]
MQNLLILLVKRTNGRLICFLVRFLLFPVRHFFDLFFPLVCPFCNEIMESHDLFCESCTAKLVTPAGMFCKRCGGKRLASNRKTFGCSRCRTTRFRFRRVIVLGEYEAELRELVLRMKTDRSGFWARTVAQLLVRQRSEELGEAKPDLIIPVPMYWWRRLSRGVNSPDILASELGHILNVPVASKLVRRIRPTDLQYTLSARNRNSNVVNAFAINQHQNRLKFFLNNLLSRLLNRWCGDCWKSWLTKRLAMRLSLGYGDLSGKNVLLVDDIFTTGSTCNAVAKVLRRAGVRSITVCAFARAVGFYTQRRANLLENLAKKSGI